MRLPIAGAVLIAFAIMFANADGYHNEWRVGSSLEKFSGPVPYAQNVSDGENEFINWTHGWPVSFAIRRNAPGYGRWPIDGAPITRFYPRWLILDFAFAVVLFAGTFYSLQRLSSFSRWRIQFGIKHLLLLTTTIAMLMMWRSGISAAVYYSVFGLILLASLLTIATFMHLIWRSVRATAAIRPN